MCAFTILGAGGFIGAALVAQLQSHDHVVHPITRASLPALLATNRPTGHVIDCIGITGDFRERPLDTADAHVGLVARCLARLSFDSFLLLSSTRVYARASVAHEDAVLPTMSADASDLYNLTKLAGEALCLVDPRARARVVRLSNVYGAAMPVDTFLGQLVDEGRATGSVVFREGPASAKDYVSLATVVRLLPAIAVAGQARLYNLASGRNTTHAAIASALHRSCGWHTSFAPEGPTVRQPLIDTTRLTGEFGPSDSNLVSDLPALLALPKDEWCLPSMRRLAA